MKILIAATGSIAVYKIFDLARSLIKKNHQVVVVTSKGAEKFINTNTFSYLGIKHFSFDQDFKNNKQGVLHIQLAKWADLFCCCPLSANSLAKLSLGFTDDLISSTFLSLPPSTPRLMFPAMNTQMLLNPITQKNIETLKLHTKAYFFPTDQGKLACGDTGPGKLLNVDHIVDLIDSYPIIEKEKPKSVLINTGATISPMDSIRYLTNGSTGLTGYYLASEFSKFGYEVHLIASKTSDKRIHHLADLPNCNVYYASTANDMYQLTKKLFKNADLFISSAAISDFEFSEIAESKIKKDKFTNQLEIKKSIDILFEMLKLKTKNQKIIGFAAESKLDLQILHRKWERKPVDLLISNLAHHGMFSKDQMQGFANEENQYIIMDGSELYQKKPTIIANKIRTKIELAFFCRLWFEQSIDKNKEDN